jgi:hypothetical protein
MSHAVAYLTRIVARAVAIALAATVGAIAAGGVVILPLTALHGVGAITYSAENDGSLVWFVSMVGGLWGAAHLLPFIAAVESAAREPRG